MTGLWTPGGDNSPQNNSSEQVAKNDQAEQEMASDDAFAGMSEDETAQALEQITKMRAEFL